MIWATFVAFLSTLWTRFALYIVVIGSGLLALLAFTAKQRAIGRQQLKDKHNKANKLAAERARQIISKLNKAGDNEIQTRIDNYYRD